jgi:predicted permease
MWWRPRRSDQDFSHEIQAHIALEMDRLVAEGVSPEEARAKALRAFGNMLRAQESFYESRRVMWLDDLQRDVRHALRTLIRNPGFTVVIVLTLALGIGANTAIYSVVNAVLLRSLPYPDPDRLVRLWSTHSRTNRWGDWVSYPDFRDWREQNRGFEDMAAYRFWLFNVTGGEYPEVVLGVYVTHNLFSVLRTGPMLGRSFLSEEDQPGRNQVVILSFGLWQRRFGSDPGLVGRTVTIDGQSHSVVGIMPRGFGFPVRETDVWIPHGPLEELQQRESHNFRVVARLKPGVTVEQAQANMDAIAGGLAERYPSNRDLGVKVLGLQHTLTNEVRQPLIILLGAVGLVLLIACANVANLLLARGVARRRETAIRQAIGAGRWRLIRQSLTEDVLLALLGGVAGLLLALWGVQFLIGLAPDIPGLEQTTIDPQVLAFTLLLSVATGLMFGTAPALQGSKVDLTDALKEAGTRSTAGSAHSRTRGLLIITEMALASMLLVSAGLLFRSFLRVVRVDPGFNPGNVLTAMVPLSPSKYPDPRRQAAFFKEVIKRIATLPRVEAASVASSVPLVSNDAGGFEVEGHLGRPDEIFVQAERPAITPDHFRVLGISLLKGRIFTWADNESSPEVAIISEGLSQRYWPGEDPIGKRVSFNSRNGERVWRQVVGVVNDVKHDGLETRSYPAIYVPMLQFPSPFGVLSVRATDPSGLAGAIRREVMAVDKDVPVFRVQTMDRLISDSVSRRRFQMMVLAIFASLALALAAAGIYGVMTYSVSQRTHEIGIRVALGAASGDVLTLILRQGLVLTLAGVAIGLLSSLALTRVLSGLLYGVSAMDPATFVVFPSALIVVALLACYLPARRATKADPMVALRYE